MVVRRYRWLVVCSLLALMPWMSVGMARASDEPYVLIQEESDFGMGQTFYNLNASYSPHAVSGQAWDAHGLPYSVEVATKNWDVSGAMRIGWGDRWAFSAGAHYGIFSALEERTYPTHQEVDRTTESTWGMWFGLQGRLRPQHPLEPKLGVSIAFPAKVVQGQLSLSAVRDPIVLSGTLSYGTRLDSPETSLTAGVGISFVANDVINLGVGIRHQVVPGTLIPPANSLSLGLGYVYDRALGRQVNFDTTYGSNGEDIIVSFGVGWSGPG